MNLIRHLESELGTIQQGWRDYSGSQPFQIISADGGRFTGVTSFCTLGLSNYGLPSSVSGKIIYHELLVMVRSSYGAQNIPALLHDIGMTALHAERALLRGEVIDGFDGIALSQTNFEAFYVASPVYFPDSFAECNLGDGRVAVVVWLIPITGKERLFIRLNGWEVFEQKLIEQDPDLFDVNRKEVLISP